MSITRVIPILIVLFLGYLGFSIVLPLFPHMFLDQHYPLLPFATSITIRQILLGLLFAMYPLGQFLGCPLLGKLSDKYGRKPIILISLLITIPAYISSALSISFSIPALLYISRFFCGLLEGNVTIAQASIADISEDKHTKAKNYGWMMALSSTAFFIGPLLSGKLTNPKIVSWFRYDTPFWGISILVLIGFFIVWTYFKDTYKPHPELHIDTKSILRSFTDGLKIKSLRKIYLSNFSIYLAMFFFLNFFSTYLVTSFSFNIIKLGRVNSYLSIFFIVAPFFFSRISKAFDPRKITMISGCFLALSLIIFVIPKNPHAYIFTLIPIGLCMAVGFAFTSIMISEGVSKHLQGHALGTNQSLQVCAEAFTAAIGGFLMAFYTTLPILVGAGCAVISAILLLCIKHHQSTN